MAGDRAVVLKLVFGFMFCFLNGMSCAAFAPLPPLKVPPPDQRTWQEIMDGIEMKIAAFFNESNDAWRLMELKDLRTMPALFKLSQDKSHPEVRTRAFMVLAKRWWDKQFLKERLDFFSSIALDDKEDDRLRAAALNPGLLQSLNPVDPPMVRTWKT
jgi:hypothetical protein